MCLKPDAEKVSKKIYLQDEYSAKNLAAPLAECNDIVKEEFEYQPGADLSRRDVLGITLLFIREPVRMKNLDFTILTEKMTKMLCIVSL